MESRLFVFVLFFACCQCFGTDYASFYGNSYISIPFKEAKSSTDIEFSFRTLLPNALLLLIAGTTDFCIVRLENSRIRININLGAGEDELMSPPGVLLNDLKWHNISISRKDANLSLTIDGTNKVGKILPGRFFELNVHYGVFIGGHGNFSELFFGHLEKFRGCLSNVKYNHIPLLEQARHRHVHSIVHSVTWNCASEFEASKDQPISFVKDKAFMQVHHFVQHNEINIHLEVNTMSQGVLLYNTGRLTSSEYFVIYIWEEKVHCSVKVSSKIVHLNGGVKISDGNWHKISLRKTFAIFELIVDGKSTSVKNNLGLFTLSDSSFIGGVEPTKLSRAMSSGCKYCDLHFKGCIRNLEISKEAVGFPDVGSSYGLISGCVWKYPCRNNPCKADSVCVQQNVDSFQCQCSDKFCIDQNYTDTYKVFSPNTLATELELLSVKAVEVMEAAPAVITSDHLHVVLDYQKYGIRDSGVKFNILEGPIHGSISINVWPHEQSFFTLDDISQDKVHYINDGLEFDHDTATLEVEFVPEATFILPEYLQGKFTFRISFNIIPVNDPPKLRISNSTVLRIIQGSQNVITNDIFQIDDPDTSSDKLVYNVHKFKGGHFEHKEKASVEITTFTQEDVDNKNIIFIYQSHSVNTTYISLQVSDGVATSPLIHLRVSVTPQYWRLKNNTGLTVLHQTFGLITPVNLSFVSNVAHADYKAQFRITKKPSFGLVEVERNPNVWRNTDVFSTSDIKQHRVRYRHVTGKPEIDEFQFQTTFDKSSLYTFRVTFISCTLQEINTKPIFMNETQEQTITKQYLSFETKPVKVLSTSVHYLITRPPKYGILSSTVSKYRLKACDTFTQEDIYSSNIKYRLFHKSYSYVSDSFSFIVFSPGCSNMTGNITVIFYPSLETKSKVMAVLHPLMVNEGGSKVIDIEHFNLKTNFLQDVVYNVTQTPSHGALKLINNNSSTFTLSDVKAKKLSYIHDDSENNHDVFKFIALSVNDNFQFVGEYNINIVMKNDNSPTRRINKVFHVVVGGDKLLTNEDLEFIDNDIDTKPIDIVYSVHQVPNGIFYNVKDKTRRVTEFSQQDLNNGQVLFKHQGPEYGKIKLWVTDGQFHVNCILEVQASAPFINIVMNKKLIVEYGKKSVITADHLLFSTNLLAKDYQVIYEIISNPSFGKIAYTGNLTALSSFTQRDINMGFVSYINDLDSANGDEIGIRVRCKDAINVIQMGVWMLPSYYWEPFKDKGVKKVLVEESTSAVITKKVLEVIQTNVPASSITYYITMLPINGYLTILSDLNDTNRDIINVLSFTQDLVNDKRVLYIQSAANETSDRISFNVTNGIIWHNNVVLNIEIIPERLYLGSNDLIVEEGGTAVITTVNIYVLTNYYKKKITEYVIVQDASHGCVQVHKRCNKFNGFSHKELSAGIIRYSHDGSEHLIDEITLVAMAGQKRSTPLTLLIRVNPINDQKPSLVNNTGILMWEGGTAIIKNTMLATTDDDIPEEVIRYQILGSWWGNVVFISDVTIPITYFTQKDIDNRRIAFHHENGTEAKFKFNVTDGVHISEDYYFFIRTKPVILTLVVKPLHIFPLQRKYLTVAHLHACVSDSNRTIYYDVTSPPTLGRLMMESNSPGTFKVVSSFTQSDINNTRVFYEHTHQFSDLYANDSFIFNVRSHLAKTLTHKVLKIDISVSSGGLDSYITIPKIQVDEGSMVAIRLNLSEVVLFLENHSGLRSPIIHASSITPQHGQLLLKQNGNYSASNAFTQQQLENALVYYDHDHSDSIGDNIHFSFYLIPHYIALCNITVPIIVNPINDQPFHLITPAPSITVVQGENKTITAHDLATEDADTPPFKLQYVVISGPNHGKLVLKPDPAFITHFTQEDIDQNRLVYIHNSSVLSDSFHFRVWDDKFRPLFKLFNINVVPVNLTISPASPLYLQQGSDAVFLSEKQFSIATNADKLKIRYKVKSQPKHGIIYVKNLPGSEFTQSELEEEQVMYLQSDLTSANDSFEVRGEIHLGNTSVSNDLALVLKVQPLMQMKNFTALAGEYNRITLQILDAGPLAKLTNSNPRYTILSLPENCKIRRVIRSSGERRNILDSVISSFTHEEIQSGLIYLAVDDVHIPYTIQDRVVFMLAASIFQPAIGELKVLLRDSMNNEVNPTLAGPNDPASHEGGYHVASPNMTRDYFVLVTMVIGVIVLGVCVIVIIKCRSFEPLESKEEQCQQMTLPRPPDRSMPKHADEPPQIPALPVQCKITPLELDPQAGYPYGDEQLEEWTSCDTSEMPCPSRSIMLRRNQYWV